MKLQWLGHSAFRLIESTGTSIITDPFDPSYVGYGMPYLPCDAITSSNGHADHNNFKAVKGNPVIINSIGTYDIGGIGIHSVATSHNAFDGQDRGRNLVYRFRLDGVSVCHLGDIGEECSPDLVEQLIPVNILLIPIGGNSTIDAEEAVEYIDRLMPDIVIPMHYKIKHSDMDIDKLDNFLKLLDEDIEVIETDDSTIEFDRFDFNGETTKVIIPTRYKG